MHQLIEISNDLETALPVERARLVRLCATITGNGNVCGYLIEWAGLIPSMFVLGACYSITTLSLLVNPALHGMERS